MLTITGSSNLAFPKRKGRIGFLLFILMFVTLWSAGTLLFDGLLLYNLVRQLQAVGYPTVEGEVKRSAAKRRGRGYKVDIEYAYVVQNQRFTSKEVRYGMTSASRRWVSDFVAAHPMKGTVSVHHNPADPADAVLDVGVSWIEWYLAMVCLMFNFFLVAIWSVVPEAFRRDPELPPDVRRWIAAGGPNASFDLRPIHVALGTAFLLHIPVLLLIGFLDWADSPQQMIVWGLDFAAAAFVYQKVARRGILS
jgi:hypothetical protein